MGFGKRITEIRVNKGYTLRSFFKDKLEPLGFKKSISQYSKIEREIQNPQNKAEFDLIIKALGITDLSLIKDLEKEAQKFIPEKEVGPEILPAFLPSHIKTPEQLEKLQKTLEEAFKPDFSEEETD